LLDCERDAFTKKYIFLQFHLIFLVLCAMDISGSLSLSHSLARSAPNNWKLIIINKCSLNNFNSTFFKVAEVEIGEMAVALVIMIRTNQLRLRKWPFACSLSDCIIHFFSSLKIFCFFYGDEIKSKIFIYYFWLIVTEVIIDRQLSIFFWILNWNFQWEKFWNSCLAWLSVLN